MKRAFFLFILLAISKTIFASDNITSLAKEQIKAKFRMLENPPKQFIPSIVIKLEGQVTWNDSLIFNELIETLNDLIERVEIYMVPYGTVNLTFNINTKANNDDTDHRRVNPYDGSTMRRKIFLNINDSLTLEARKKIIYFHALRSIASFNKEVKTSSVFGSVFTEEKPENITFHPVDFEIIKILYSKPKWYKLPFKGYGYFLGLILVILYLFILSQKGAFNNHKYILRKYLKQGVLVFLAFLIYFIVQIIAAYFNSDFPGNTRTGLSQWFLFIFGVFQTFFGVVFLGIVIILPIYFIEWRLLRKNKNFIAKVFVPFITTLLVPLIIFIPFYSYTITGIILLSFWPILMLIAFARGFYIYITLQSENQIRKKDLELAKLGEMHKQAELQSLRAKINPHFLYNSLNSIASLATTNPKQTEKMALALSDFFKYSINREQKQLNSIAEELNATRIYLEIEKMRFIDRLNFEISCDEKLLNIQIPQLLIQPLAENAVKHGIANITENGWIKIVVEKTDLQLIIRVYDNGPAFPAGPLSGFGIRNTTERLNYLYGNKSSVNWVNGIEKYIEIKLPLSL